MKKMILFLTILLFTVSLVFAATVTVGTGTSTDRYPLGDFYVYQRSQMLFLSSEIGMGGTVSHLRWYRNDDGADPNAVDVQIWLKETADASIVGAWEDPGTLVYSGTGIDLGSGNDWLEIDITDFAYNGSSNLLVSTYCQNAPYTSPHSYWRYTTTSPTYMMRRGQSDSTNPPSISLSYSRPNIQFEFLVPGAPVVPTNPSPADDATGVALSGNLTWTFGADTDNYDLWFGEAGSMVEVVDNAVIGAGTYAYSSLSEDTEYEWQVIAHNSSDRATTNGPVWSFTTLILPITSYPYTEDFEDVWIGSPAAPPSWWSQITVSGTNVWEISTTSPHGGTYCAKAPYISGAGGGEHLLITPELVFGTTDYRLKFWLKGNSSTGTDLKVQIANDNSAAGSFTTDLAYYVAGTNMPTTWTEYTIALSAYENSQYIAIE